MTEAKEKIVLEKYDKILAITFVLLTSAIMVVKLFNLSISLAIYNFIITVLPSIIYIVKYRIKMEKKYFLIICITFLIGILNLLIYYNKLILEDKLEECVNIITLLINLLMIYGVVNSNKIFKTKYQFKHIYNAIIGVSIIFCIYNIFNNLYQFKYFSSVKNLYLINFSSFFDNRNNFAIFLFMAICSTFFVQKVDYKLKIIRIFFIINLIITLSRTGIIAFISFTFIYNILTSKKRITIIIFTLIVILIILINPYNINSFTQNYIIREEAGSSGRVEVWETSWNIFKKSPLVGYGDLMSRQNVKALSNITSNAHSLYLKTLLTYGVIGTVSFCYLLYDLVKKDIYIYKNNSKIGVICISVLISTLIYGITEQVNFFSFGTINIMITFLNFIFPIYYYNQIRSEQIDGENKHNNTSI